MPAIVSKIPATTKKYYQKIRETVLMMLLTILARIFEFILRYYASNGVSSSSSLVDRRPMLKSAVIETRRCPFVRLFLIFFFPVSRASSNLWPDREGFYAVCSSDHAGFPRPSPVIYFPPSDANSSLRLRT